MGLALPFPYMRLIAENDHTIEIGRRQQVALSTDDSNALYLPGAPDGPAEALRVRGVGPFAGCAIQLPGLYDYVLGMDEHGVLLLVPLRKTEDDDA